MSIDLRPVLNSQDRGYPPGRLADDFVAEDRGQATERFIDWALRVRRAAMRRSG